MIANVLDWVGALALLLGSLLTLVAAIGVLRLPDLLSRMHAATKPQVLGLTLMMLGLAITVREISTAWTLILVIAFQMVTAPISAHMVSRGGYRTGRVESKNLAADALRKDLTN